ncbi:MAG: ABC transporter ATP-binding protein [Chitinophagales bacterium]|nr:ABC transporter ATP-binding protein [Chitinophagales bacterium]MDW8273182.1 ABC transporter ATP-binding protein [Chitinophagales bacterium]
MNYPAAELKNLSKHYGKLIAVDSINISIPRGEIFGLLGPNGAGKSTTLRMMLSLIRPTSGEIFFFGKSLFSHRREVLANIGSIIEKPDFYLYLTAKENLWLLAKMNGISSPDKKIKEILNLVGLEGREDDKVKTYSHGMKQRLGIAQALLHDPDFIILDEPTTGLDPQGIIDLRYLLLRLKNEFNKTIALSSHILNEVELIADSMAIIHHGKAVVQGKVTELLTNEQLIVKIESDYTSKVLSVLQETAFAKQLIRYESDAVFINISRNKIPDVVTLLVQHDVPVYSISYQRPLEEYFLKITSQTNR